MGQRVGSRVTTPKRADEDGSFYWMSANGRFPPGHLQPTLPAAPSRHPTQNVQNEFSPSATSSFFTAKTRRDRRKAFISASASPRFLMGKTKSLSCLAQSAPVRGLEGHAKNCERCAGRSLHYRSHQFHAWLRCSFTDRLRSSLSPSRLLRAAPPAVLVLTDLGPGPDGSLW